MDYESLLVNWLTELLWLQESHHETYQRFNIETLSPTALRAQVFGTPMTGVDKIIKAVTYHNLEIKQTREGWQVVVVVDV
jgi:SHS2 domain-containing protein